MPHLLGLLCLVTCYQKVLMSQATRIERWTVNAPLAIKWVAIDKVFNQRASKTLISLLIPHLPLFTLHS